MIPCMTNTKSDALDPVREACDETEPAERTLESEAAELDELT